MKSLLKFLTTMFIIVVAIVATVILKVEPTITDSELMLMIADAETTDEIVNSVTDDVDTITTTINTTDVETQVSDVVEETIIEETVNDTEPETTTSTTIPTVSCYHKETSVQVTDATCTASGKKIVVCNECGEKINETHIPKLSHNLKTTTKKATCAQNGEVKTFCTVCGYVQKIEKTDKESHPYLALVDEKLPTPFENGHQTHKCTSCNKSFYTTLIFDTIGDVDLYVPAANIHCSVNLGECNQSNTDNYDVTCDMNFINSNNPLFFGHNTRTLGKLPNIKVGDLMYFTVNGKTTVYKVIVSEEGNLVNGGTDIKGYKTQTSVIAPCEKETLHFFTCYPYQLNYSRWIVLAEKVDM